MVFVDEMVSLVLSDFRSQAVVIMSLSGSDWFGFQCTSHASNVGCEIDGERAA